MAEFDQIESLRAATCMIWSADQFSRMAVLVLLLISVLRIVLFVNWVTLLKGMHAIHRGTIQRDIKMTLLCRHAAAKSGILV